MSDPIRIIRQRPTLKGWLHNICEDVRCSTMGEVVNIAILIETAEGMLKIRSFGPQGQQGLLDMLGQAFVIVEGKTIRDDG